MRPLRFLGFVLILVLLVVLLGPLVIPVPPLMDTVPEEQLADDDSQFIEVDSILVHYKVHGSGEPVMLLMHGFGSSTYTWADVIQPLAEHGTVIAYDRPAFGLTERPIPGEWVGESPYSNESQVEMAVGLMDALGIEKAILVGHSAGGTIAIQTALAYPQRVSGLVLVDAALYGSRGIPDALRFLVNTPQLKRLGPFFARSLAGKEGDAFLEAAWYDFTKFSEEDKAAYRKPLQAENWDIALWELTKANRNVDLTPRLVEISQPVLVVTGANDRIIMPELSEQLAADIPNAQYESFPLCGHVPQEECPQVFLTAVLNFIETY